MVALISDMNMMSVMTATGGNSGVTGVAVADVELVGVVVAVVEAVTVDVTGCDKYSLDSATKV